MLPQQHYSFLLVLKVTIIKPYILHVIHWSSTYKWIALCNWCTKRVGHFEIAMGCTLILHSLHQSLVGLVFAVSKTGRKIQSSFSGCSHGTIADKLNIMLHLHSFSICTLLYSLMQCCDRMTWRKTCL